MILPTPPPIFCGRAEMYFLSCDPLATGRRLFMLGEIPWLDETERTEDYELWDLKSLLSFSLFFRMEATTERIEIISAGFERGKKREREMGLWKNVIYIFWLPRWWLLLNFPRTSFSHLHLVSFPLRKFYFRFSSLSICQTASCFSLPPSSLSFSFVCRVCEKQTRGGFCWGLGRGVTGQEKNWNSGQFFFVYLQQGLGRWHQTVIILRCRNRRRCLDHQNSKVIYPLRQHRRRGEEEKGDNKSRNARVLFCPSLANRTRTLSFHLFEQDTKHVQYVCSGTLYAPSPALYWWNHTFYFQDVSIWFLDCAQTLKSTKRKVTSRVLPDAIGIRPKKPTLLLLLFKEHYFS